MIHFIARITISTIGSCGWSIIYRSLTSKNTFRTIFWAGLKFAFEKQDWGIFWYTGSSATGYDLTSKVLHLYNRVVHICFCQNAIAAHLFTLPILGCVLGNYLQHIWDRPRCLPYVNVLTTGVVWNIEVVIYIRNIFIRIREFISSFFPFKMIKPPQKPGLSCIFDRIGGCKSFAGAIVRITSLAREYL